MSPGFRRPPDWESAGPGDDVSTESWELQTIGNGRVAAAVIHVVAVQRGTPAAGGHRHHFFGSIFAALPAREVSSMRKVATCTSTRLRQRGHRGFLVLAVMPSRYDS